MSYHPSPEFAGGVQFSMIACSNQCARCTTLDCENCSVPKIMKLYEKKPNGGYRGMREA